MGNNMTEQTANGHRHQAAEHSGQRHFTLGYQDSRGPAIIRLRGCIILQQGAGTLATQERKGGASERLAMLSK